jgi:pyrimidine operon attenuation protein/uracil phosphoribosyltransferase
MARSGPKKILDAAGIDRAVTRLAEEILERNPGGKGLALIGVRTRGVPLARRLAARIQQMEKAEVPVGVLDITLYRDDFSTVASQPIVRKTDISFPVKDRRIVLVDDVLYTGRTARAALDGVIDFGRPRQIQLAVLVDRGLRELPIQADFVGKTVSTTSAEFVQVKLTEEDGADAVFVGDVPKPRKRTGARG